MSRTYRYGRSEDGESRERPAWSRPDQQTFRCRHCKVVVGPIPYGGKHRNHCPYCLYSRHVDDRTPGDRAIHCGALMAPAGAFTRARGEHAVVHRCLGCGVERHNRIAADDDFARVLGLLAGSR